VLFPGHTLRGLIHGSSAHLCRILRPLAELHTGPPTRSRPLGSQNLIRFWGTPPPQRGSPMSLPNIHFSFPIRQSLSQRPRRIRPPCLWFLFFAISTFPPNHTNILLSAPTTPSPKCSSLSNQQTMNNRMMKLLLPHRSLSSDGGSKTCGFRISPTDLFPPCSAIHPIYFPMPGLSPLGMLFHSRFCYHSFRNPFNPTFPSLISPHDSLSCILVCSLSGCLPVFIQSPSWTHCPKSRTYLWRFPMRPPPPPVEAG